MSARVWGNIPDEPYEIQALAELTAQLSAVPGSYHVFVNFMVGGEQVDLFIVVPDPQAATLFLIELKFAGRKAIHLAANQPLLLDERPVANHRNPLDQMVRQYRQIRCWLWSEREGFLAPAAASGFAKERDWDGIKKLLVFCPMLPESARIDLSQHESYFDEGRRRGAVIGFDHLANYLCRPDWRSRDAMPPLDEAGALRLARRLCPQELDPKALQGNWSESAATARLEEVPPAWAKPEMPTQPEPRVRRALRWLAFGSLVGALVVGGALWWLLGGLRPSPCIDVAAAKDHIGRKAVVCFTVGRIETCGSSTCIQAQGSVRFSVQVLGSPVADIRLANGNPIREGDCVSIGPAKIVTSDSNNPQVEVGREGLAEILKRCNDG
jgi:hypothetical protein